MAFARLSPKSFSVNYRPVVCRSLYFLVVETYCNLEYQPSFFFPKCSSTKTDQNNYELHCLKANKESHIDSWRWCWSRSNSICRGNLPSCRLVNINNHISKNRDIYGLICILTISDVPVDWDTFRYSDIESYNAEVEEKIIASIARNRVALKGTFRFP